MVNGTMVLVECWAGSGKNLCRVYIKLSLIGTRRVKVTGARCKIAQNFVVLFL